MIKWILPLLFVLPGICAAKVIEKIVAIVNDEIITTSDLEAYRERLKVGKMLDELLPVDRKAIVKSDGRHDVAGAKIRRHTSHQ